MDMDMVAIDIMNKSTQRVQISIKADPIEFQTLTGTSLSKDTSQVKFSQPSNKQLSF